MLPMMLFTFISLVLMGCLAFPFGPNQPTDKNDDMVDLFSTPGITFRRAQPMSGSNRVRTRSVQNHMKLKRVPSHPASRHHSAVSLLHDRPIFDNISVVNQYATQYSVEVILDGEPMNLIFDSGSSDTWVHGKNFTCLNSLVNTTTTPNCDLGPAFPLDFPHGPEPDIHFALKYEDGEGVAGKLGRMMVNLGGIEVPDQEVAIATQGVWYGNNITSGNLGMAYPSLTNAYSGNDLSNADPDDQVVYSPIFSSIISNNVIEPYWSIAINRNSTEGLFALGEMVPVDLNGTHWVEVPMLTAKLADKQDTAYRLSYYTVVPDGFSYEQEESDARYPFILDTGTTITYLPPDLADAVNRKFIPPAKFLWYYGSYFTDCNAIPPKFQVIFDDSVFPINPIDMINKEVKDPLTGLCQTTISSGGTGPYILGVNFLQNVIAVFNIDLALIEFYSREFY